MDSAVIYKQLADHRSGKRLWGVMEGMAKALSRLMSRAISRGVRAGCQR
jgi:cytochrome c553